MDNTIAINASTTRDSNAGAEFVRADLHIHSFGPTGSFEVSDSSMTPENIVDTAHSKGISVISITDHNEIENVKIAIKHAEGKPVLIIPGIEVTTTQGHLLVYFETYEELRRFYGKLNVDSKRERCSQGITECLDLAEQLNGIGVLAHIELTSGFEKVIGRFGREMDEILAHKNLLGLEISSKESVRFYTDADELDERKQLIKKRRERLNLDPDFEIAKVMSSDSHTLSRLGTNAEGLNKITRIKMDERTFHSLKVALLCPSSRIRLEELVPDRIPRFREIRFEGGLLDKQVIDFSPNLTCIIGGRGTGKSTLLHAIQEASGNGTDDDVVDSDVWPQKITIVYEDETGRNVELIREKNADVRNAHDSLDGITGVPIEGYGQGETAETIQHSDKNPRVLIDFLDRFIDLRSLILEDYKLRQLLIENQSELRRLRTEVATIPEKRRIKSNLEQKIRKLKKDKVEELVNLQVGLIKERELRRVLVEDLKSLASNYKSVLSDKSTLDEIAKIDGAEIIVGRENFERVRTLVEEFGKIVDEKSSELNDALTAKLKDLGTQIRHWTDKEAGIQAEIDKKKEELEKKDIPFDLGLINQLAKDDIYYEGLLKTLLRQVEELKLRNQDREKLLKERRSVKAKIYYQRLGFATTVNDNLKNTVDDLLVSVKYRQGCFSPNFEEGIKFLMQWKTAKVPKADNLACNCSPLDFAAAIKSKNLDILKAVLDEDGDRVFDDKEIQNILSTALSDESYEDFESMPFEDLPSITVTKMVDDGTGKLKPLTKGLSQLSLGQQQSILLAILLQSKSNTPLIIDQPEDNLDSEFIYKTIVANLRRIKESRQVIVVTHNPNIAVLGDAELIIPLKSTSLRTTIINRGSIDKKATRQLCCEILEGGERAFNRRKEIYGLS
jgi:DNA repair ATPase RecN/histidinol phosphatase-like PHP family hydrolase